MLRGTGVTSSVIHAAGSPGGGVSARPKALVVLVNTKRPTPAATASSSRFSVPVTLVSTKSARPWEPTWGLWSVAACRTASTPCTQSRTHGAVGDRPHHGGERGREDVEPADVVALVAEDAHERLAEMARAAGDQDPHLRQGGRGPR